LSAFSPANWHSAGNPQFCQGEEILSRIPINIIDRLITAYADYGIALALRALLYRVV
jgi:hypothetical protein